MGKKREREAESAGEDELMVKVDVEGQESEAEEKAQPGTYVSPIASPMANGKLKEKVVKLLKKSIAFERSQKSVAGTGSKDKKDDKKVKKTITKRCVKRGVAEVSKCIRKGAKGIVFLASDVYPIEILAHIPLVCEAKEILYVYVSPKKALGASCSSNRPASVVMVTTPQDDFPTLDLYEKVEKGIRKINPYF
eukprot:GHVN01026088.1.p1 GENE.GHVN01026088.1~~GHVN01026088.1.p1  ORF type:complete len:205 (+),score=56.42 GHVN01026088.1:37-615(+)